MDAADSDSDDFFSDIRALRRQFGINQTKTAVDEEIRKRHIETKSAAILSKKIDQNDDNGDGKRQENTSTPLSAERSSKRLGRTLTDNSDSQKSTGSPPASLSLGSVSPGEIAALLSPRKQRQKTGNRLASRRRSSGIPPRTPESRIASPQAPLFSPRPALTPTSAKTPQRTLRGGVSTSASPVIYTGFNMRSLWSKETAASPLNTPTGQRLRLSPAVIHKRSPPPSGFKGLVFRLDAAEPSSTDPGQLGLLGSVEEALVTDADLEASRRKLGEEYALTQQQIIREVRDRVMAFACSSEVGLRLAEWRESVSILCQFYTLGHGRLAFTKQGIVWCGYMLGPISAVSQSSDSSIASNDYEAAANTTLLFPWTRVTSLRRKDIDDSCFVMATVDHDLGVAFNMGDHQSHEPASDIGAMVAKMNELLSDVLRNESASQQTPELASQSVDRGHLESYHMDQRKGRDVILYALELAKSHDKRFVDLDVPGILHSEDFMASSMSSVLEFSLILAKKASAVMEHDPVTIDDDPETESAPGTCTLCYAENESVVFQQCDHKVCESCFSHLRAMGSSSSSQPISSARIACICPWDRTEIESWIKI